MISYIIQKYCINYLAMILIPRDTELFLFNLNYENVYFFLSTTPALTMIRIMLCWHRHGEFDVFTSNSHVFVCIMLKIMCALFQSQT